MDTKESSPLDALAYLMEDLRMIETLCKKTYDSIRKYANAPELAKAVHPEQTGIISHIKRLKLIKVETSKVEEKRNAFTAPFGLPKKLKKGNERDLWLIAKSQQIIYQKLPMYKVALEIATHLNLAHSISLITQTIEENEATCTWLQRILPRILNGETIIPIQTDNNI
jgi:ferritin-like metal-binding protein YciE